MSSDHVGFVLRTTMGSAAISFNYTTQIVKREIKNRERQNPTEQETGLARPLVEQAAD